MTLLLTGLSLQSSYEEVRTISHIREAVEGAGTVAEGTGSVSADIQSEVELDG